jgi:limonene-1,2-epoxide hydrolase
MTGPDLALCRRFSAALAALDLDAALADTHPQIELHTPCETLHGAAGLRTLLAPPPLDYLERTIIIDDVIDAGERAVALGRIQLRWRDTDEPADTQHVGAVLDLREGRVIRWQAFPDPDAALAAAADGRADTDARVGARDAAPACRTAGPCASTAPATQQ